METFSYINNGWQKALRFTDCSKSELMETLIASPHKQTKQPSFTDCSKSELMETSVSAATWALAKTLPIALNRN